MKRLMLCSLLVASAYSHGEAIPQIMSGPAVAYKGLNKDVTYIVCKAADNALAYCVAPKVTKADKAGPNAISPDAYAKYFHFNSVVHTSVVMYGGTIYLALEVK
jgi:hypothetical protein